MKISHWTPDAQTADAGSAPAAAPAATPAAITYRKSDGSVPAVRERDGQVVSPGLVLTVCQGLFSGGAAHTLKEVCESVAAHENCSLAWDSEDLETACDTLLRRWHGAGWLAATMPDGTVAKPRKPSGGRKGGGAKSSGLGDSEKLTAPMGSVITWMTGADGDADRREISHTLARAETILVSVVSPAIVCAHIMDVLIRQTQSAATCRLYAIAAQLTQLVTGTHSTHNATASTMECIRGFDSMSDDKVVSALKALDIAAIAAEHVSNVDVVPAAEQPAA